MAKLTLKEKQAKDKEKIKKKQAQLDLHEKIETALEKKLDKVRDTRNSLEDEICDLDYSLDDIKENYHADAEYAKFKLPAKGAFTAYKKVEDEDGFACLAVLKVPAKAKRVTPKEEGDFKSRVSEALVEKIVRIDDNVEVDTGYPYVHTNNNGFKYVVGKIAKVKNFDDSVDEACTYGIHCFKTRKQALDY